MCVQYTGNWKTLEKTSISIPDGIKCSKKDGKTWKLVEGLGVWKYGKSTLEKSDRRLNHGLFTEQLSWYRETIRKILTRHWEKIMWRWFGEFWLMSRNSGSFTFHQNLRLYWWNLVLTVQLRNKTLEHAMKTKGSPRPKRKARISRPQVKILLIWSFCYKSTVYFEFMKQEHIGNHPRY